MDKVPAKAARWRMGLPILAAAAFGLAAVAALPRAYDAALVLWVRDDSTALAEHHLDRVFNAEVAAREVETALAAGDTELAKSFVELAQARNVTLSPALLVRVEAAVVADASPTAKAGSFARGLITGEPDDLASLAGTAVGDLFVYGDIRDAVREGGRWASGGEVDHVILGLSGVGIAITAGTYASLGIGAPARAGLTLVKAARKTGALGTRMAETVSRSLRGAVDQAVLQKAMATASLTKPALAVRAVREAVKIEKADDLFRLTRDVGRVQTKAGTRAAFDGLKLADEPRDMARVAKLAEKQGGKTRAVLKLLGRGAIMLTTGAFQLAVWVLWAAMLVFGFVSSLKGVTERMTLRYLRHRKVRRLKRALAMQEARLAGAAAAV